MPGQIENWIIVIDFEKMGLTEIPYKQVGGFISTLQNQYRCTSARIFILNVNWAFSIIWKVVNKFLEGHTKKKITTTSQNTNELLQELVAPEQLEEKYGGSAYNPAHDDDNYWPPRINQAPCGHDESKLCPMEEYYEWIQSKHKLMRMPEELSECPIVSETPRIDLQYSFKAKYCQADPPGATKSGFLGMQIKKSLEQLV